MPMPTAKTASLMFIYGTFCFQHTIPDFTVCANRLEKACSWLRRLTQSSPGLTFDVDVHRILANRQTSDADF